MAQRFMPFLMVLLCAPGFAANTRSAVSVHGVDSNPCTPAAPCRSFTAAIMVTAAGGEIVALDSAGYGPFTINSAIAVLGAPGVHAAITASSGSGITVAAPNTDRVLLRNLVFIGTGASVGIDQTFVGTLRVLNCLIRGFTVAGIRTSFESGELEVDHCTILDTKSGNMLAPAAGVSVDGGGDFLTGFISNCRLAGNDIGIDARDSGLVSVTETTITDSVIGGRAVATAAFCWSFLVLKSCTISHNVTGVIASAVGSSNADVYLSQDDIDFNQTGADVVVPGRTLSFGTNRFDSNTSDYVSLGLAVSR